VTDLIKSKPDLINWGTDLVKSLIDLVNWGTELINPTIDRVKSVTDLIKWMIDLINWTPFLTPKNRPQNRLKPPGAAHLPVSRRVASKTVISGRNNSCKRSIQVFLSR
jgi:hypothetical protein